MSDIAQFISAMPKAELHVHIEGTIEADLLLGMADRNGIELPYKSAEDILSGQNTGKSDPKQILERYCNNRNFIISGARKSCGSYQYEQA